MHDHNNDWKEMERKEYKNIEKKVDKECEREREEKERVCVFSPYFMPVHLSLLSLWNQRFSL